MSFDYRYLGKPSGKLPVKRSYRELDRSRWDPPRAGFEHTLVYLNVEPLVWKGGSAGIGVIRVRIMRERDKDATGYCDLPVLRSCLDDGSAVLTYTYWELGDGQPTHVELRCQGDLREARIGTRYTKKAVVL